MQLHKAAAELDLSPHIPYNDTINKREAEPCIIPYAYPPCSAA